MPRMITFDDNGIRFTNRIIGVALDRVEVIGRDAAATGQRDANLALGDGWA